MRHSGDDFSGFCISVFRLFKRLEQVPKHLEQKASPSAQAAPMARHKEAIAAAYNLLLYKTNELRNAADIMMGKGELDLLKTRQGYTLQSSCSSYFVSSQTS